MMSMQKAEAKYKAIFEALKEEILGGKYSATRKLPSEAQLMRRFGGSRVTVIHALQELRERGLIVRQKGSGSFLAANARNYGRTLGLVIPISRGEIFPPICREVTRLAQQDGYAILLADFMAAPPEHRVAEARRIMEDFVARDVLGVVFHLTDGVPDATRVNEAALKVLWWARTPWTRATASRATCLNAARGGSSSSRRNSAASASRTDAAALRPPSPKRVRAAWRSRGTPATSPPSGRSSGSTAPTPSSAETTAWPPTCSPRSARSENACHRTSCSPASTT